MSDSDAGVMGQMEVMGKRAREVSRIMADAPAGQRARALIAASAAIKDRSSEILEANARDIEAAHVADLSAAMTERLTLSPARVCATADGVAAIAAIPDPAGAVIAAWTRPNGLQFERVRVPLGVIAIIYESRPNVTADAAALCVRAGNACILRCGSDCLHSSVVLAEAMRDGLRTADLPEDAIQLVPTRSRAAVGALLRLSDTIDVVVPRGGRSLIERIQKESRIPVLAHLDGNCHVYVDRDASPTMACAVLLNSKMRRVSVCGAAETLLVDKEIAETMLPLLAADLTAAGCEIRGDPQTCALWPKAALAVEEDWSREYLDAIIACRVVDGVAAAIDHINTYGSHHTDCIITSNDETARHFLHQVDSAIVLHNASTQFADGGEFGFGGEIGIATGRLHARGPVGAEQLTTFKYVVRGSGQVRP